MGSIMKGVRGLLWVCTLVYVCHAVQIGHTSVNVPDVENVATANGASVRVQEDGKILLGKVSTNERRLYTYVWSLLSLAKALLWVV